MNTTQRNTGDAEMIKFNKYHVTDGSSKARCHYSLDNRVDGRACVTIYAKDYDHNLSAIFGDCYHNDTDSQTDYFERGRVVLFEDHPLYAVARQRVESFNQPKAKSPKVESDPTEVSITEVNRQVSMGNAYTYVEMTCGKHAALVCLCKGARNYVRVIVQNASNRAWRGMGKEFQTLSDAIGSYKTSAIRQMIREAAKV